MLLICGDIGERLAKTFFYYDGLTPLTPRHVQPSKYLPALLWPTCLTAAGKQCGLFLCADPKETPWRCVHHKPTPNIVDLTSSRWSCKRSRWNHSHATDVHMHWLFGLHLLNRGQKKNLPAPQTTNNVRMLQTLAVYSNEKFYWILLLESKSIVASHSIEGDCINWMDLKVFAVGNECKQLNIKAGFSKALYGTEYIWSV